MSALRQALGKVYPTPGMDPDTVRSITAGLVAIERSERSEEIARPMREMFAMLAEGEVFEIDGRSVMQMPESGESRDAWCEISPAIFGWIDCWRRIAPDISTKRLQYLAERLSSDKPLTPRLVEQARDEFESTIRRIVDLPDDKIRDALLTTRIAWEIEKLQEKEA